MKPVHISDSSLGLSFPLLNDTPENIIKVVKDKHAGADLFLINLNYKTENIARADNAGILFLKYLRLNHFNQHCVLYSFLSREQLMIQDPHNSIIFSEGVSFIRMPEDLSKVEFKSLAKKQAPDNLSSFFKAEFRLPDDRHFFANWWGVLQLWKVQKAVENIAGKTIISDIEQGFAGSLKEMHSYDGLVARYVKGIHDKDIESTLKMLISSKAERFKNETKSRNQAQHEINQFLADDYILIIQQNTLDELSQEEQGKLFAKLISLFNILPTSLQKKIEDIKKKRSEKNDNIKLTQEYIDLIDLITKEKKRIYEYRRKLNRQIQSKIDTLISNKSFLTEDYALDIIRQKLAAKKPSVLFVDDLANDGWATIFQRMIYGGMEGAFTVLQPENDDNIEKIVDSIEGIIKTKKIDLLILDLRLQGETGNNLNIEEISGIRVLKKLIANHLPCPVLITSASNKIWSYKETMKLGADAYWIKEGLDDNYRPNVSIENYLRFIDLVYSLCFNEEYRFLYDKLYPAILKIINTTTSFWWETKFWKKDSYTFSREDRTLNVCKSKLVDKEEIKDTLNAGFDFFKKYLSEKIQKYETINISKYIGSLVIIQLSRVLEIIHRFDEHNDRISLSEKMKAQLNDQTFNNFSELKNIRNSATHTFTADFNTIKNFIDLFIEYLTSDILNKSPDELKKHERASSEPINDEWYSSEIESVHPKLPIFYLKNPNLRLIAGRNSILLHIGNIVSAPKPEQSDMGELIGKKIEFQLDINLNATGQVDNYYAKNAKIIE